MLTALQCLFSSRKHTTGQHSCGSQPFQRQHTFTLLSAGGKKNKEIILFLSPLTTLGLCPLCQQFTSAPHRTCIVTTVNTITCIWEPMYTNTYIGL